MSLLTYPHQFPTTFRVMWLTYTFGKQLWTQNPNNQISQLKLLPQSIAQLIPSIHDRSSSLIPNTKSCHWKLILLMESSSSIDVSLRRRAPMKCFCSKKTNVSGIMDIFNRRFYRCPNYWILTDIKHRCFFVRFCCNFGLKILWVLHSHF